MLLRRSWALPRWRSGRTSCRSRSQAVVKVTPNKAGTPSHPQGIKVDVRAKIDIPHDYDPPLVESVTVWIGPGGIYNGAKLPVCNFKALQRSGPRRLSGALDYGARDGQGRR